MSFEDESPVGVEALNLQDRHAAKMTASSPRARERWITGSWTATVTKKGPSPLLVETPQAQPSMKPSVSDAVRREKNTARRCIMKGNQNFGPITPPPRYGEPPMWQATAVAAPLTIDGARNFREFLYDARRRFVEDGLVPELGAGLFCVARLCERMQSCFEVRGRKNSRAARGAAAIWLTALDYARHHHT